MWTESLDLFGGRQARGAADALLTTARSSRARATAPQPCYEVRVRDGAVEVREPR
jgi:hypothetical protein